MVRVRDSSNRLTTYTVLHGITWDYMELHGITWDFDGNTVYHSYRCDLLIQVFNMAIINRFVYR